MKMLDSSLVLIPWFAISGWHGFQWGMKPWVENIANHLYLNSLAPGRFKFNFRKVIFKLTWVNGSWAISHEIALRWMPLDLTDDKSTLVQVMAWCRQAASHTWANVDPDLCRQMASLGLNELILNERHHAATTLNIFVRHSSFCPLIHGILHTPSLFTALLTLTVFQTKKFN